MFLLKSLILSCIYFVLFNNSVNAQPVNPADYGLKEFLLKDSRLGLIRFYLSAENLTKKMPLFLEINGSGGLPLCLYTKGNGFSTTSTTFNTKLKDLVKVKFRYVILGKPGIPFCDTACTAQDAAHYDAHAVASAYHFPAAYSKQLSLTWRVEASKRVISYLIRHGFWDGTKLVAYGYSEGAQVAPALAVADKRITHVVAIAGSGLNQFYDGMITWRVKAAKGEITQQQAQDSINDYLGRVKDIYQHSESMKQYAGHTYKRWASFGLEPPFEKLRMLRIPVYIVAATADENSPIYGLDYVQLDFIRLGKTNLTYDTCVGCDHFLNSTENGSTVNHSDAYLARIMKWLGK